jgi:hypothetical protein
MEKFVHRGLLPLAIFLFLSSCSTSLRGKSPADNCKLLNESDSCIDLSLWPPEGGYEIRTVDMDPVCGKHYQLKFVFIFAMALNKYNLLMLIKVVMAQPIQTTVWRKVMASVIGQKAFVKC